MYRIHPPPFLPILVSPLPNHVLPWFLYPLMYTRDLNEELVAAGYPPIHHTFAISHPIKSRWLYLFYIYTCNQWCGSRSGSIWNFNHVSDLVPAKKKFRIHNTTHSKCPTIATVQYCASAPFLGLHISSVHGRWGGGRTWPGRYLTRRGMYNVL